jgi:hypothetical protein
MAKTIKSLSELGTELGVTPTDTPAVDPNSKEYELIVLDEKGNVVPLEEFTPSVENKKEDERVGSDDFINMA